MDSIEGQHSLFPELEPLRAVRRPDSYFIDFQSHNIVRETNGRDGTRAISHIALGETRRDGSETDAHALFDYAWLRSKAPPDVFEIGFPVRAVDLFAGCGAMSLGVAEAARALGRKLEIALAVDRDSRAIDVYAQNFKEANVQVDAVETLLNGELSEPPTTQESDLRERLGEIDLLIGGPPCQGHSDLNNSTRRNDPKNALYSRMARFAEVVRPKCIIIENVPGAIHDRGQIVQTTVSALKKIGYYVSTGILRADRFGVAQKRRRFFTVASLKNIVNFDEVDFLHNTGQRSFDWACGDLSGVLPTNLFDSPSPASNASRRRMDFLFEADLYDLPNSERPDCHRLKPHTYSSVYGRLRPDHPSPTITSGFGSMGQGRYVHPRLRRTITPHEAARLQFLPDFFSFGRTARHAMQEMIGNAVPPKLAYVLALELLR